MSDKRLIDPATGEPYLLPGDYEHELRAEIERLRAALQDLERAAQAMLDCTDDSERSYLSEEVANARRALEGPPPAKAEDKS
jgi:hypothetical protein